MSDDLRGKLLLATDAGSGIEGEGARGFASRGTFVFGADLNEKGLAEPGILAADSDAPLIGVTIAD